MEVRTLNKNALVRESQKLAQTILGSSFKPELLIGIKTGGIYVSKPLHQEIEKEYQLFYNEVSLSRVSSEKKRAFRVDKILKRLPYTLLNILRNIEVFIFETTKAKEYQADREKELLIDETLLQQIQNVTKILLIDDAIDTGTTILTIKNRILAIKPEMEIKVAVLTTTHKEPFIRADFSLYNRVLLRCPWAQDYKGSD